jgi:hypothetical protein
LKRLIPLWGILFLLFLATHVNAYSITASTNKAVYAVNENMIISGTINYTGSINVTANIYSASLIDTLTTTASGGVFTFSSYFLNQSKTPAGTYYVIVSDENDSVNISFDVVSELLSMGAHLIYNSSVIPINTSE